MFIEGGAAGILGGGRDNRRSAGTDARLLSATAAVFDAAFFHSMQLPQKMDVFMLSTPMSLPKIAETFVHLYCNLKRRWLGNQGLGGDGGSAHGSGDLLHEDSRLDLFSRSSRAHPGECVSRGARAVEPGTGVASDETLSRRRKMTLDRVVRALNGISDVSRSQTVVSQRPLVQN